MRNSESLPLSAGKTCKVYLKKTTANYANVANKEIIARSISQEVFPSLTLRALSGFAFIRVIRGGLLLPVARIFLAIE